MPRERAKEKDGTRKLDNRNALSGFRNYSDVEFPVLLERKPQKAGKQAMQILLRLCPSEIAITFTKTATVLTHGTTGQHPRAWLLKVN